MGEQVHTFESLCERRVKNRRIEYLVKWRGFGRAHNTWEPLSSFDATAKALHELFIQKAPAKKAPADRLSVRAPAITKEPVEVPSRCGGGASVRARRPHAPSRRPAHRPSEETQRLERMERADRCGTLFLCMADRFRTHVCRAGGRLSETIRSVLSVYASYPLRRRAGS